MIDGNQRDGNQALTKARDSGGETALRFLLCGAFLATLLVFSVMSAVGSPNDFQSDYRLLPLFLFAHGLPVYYDPANSPIFGPIYSPLSFLAYFPALLFRSPAPAIFCAKFLAQLFTVFPLLWLLWRRSPRTGIGTDEAIVLMSLALVAIGRAAPLNELTIFHADAPALFFCFCACMLTERVAGASSSRLIGALALCCVLAPWAKQVAAPIVFVPLITFFRLRTWKVMARFAAIYLLLMGIVSAFFLVLFRHQRMMFWILRVPALEMNHVTRARLIYAAEIPLRSFTLQILLAVVICHLLQRRIRRPRSSPSDIESIVLLAALVGAILGFAKPGGASNTLVYFAYFAFIVALLWVQRLARAWRYPDGRTAAFLRGGLVVIVAFSGVAVARSLAPNASLVWGRTYGSRESVAYEFMRRHPGEIWFARYPLAGYLAEGKVYHCDMGFFDHRLAGLPIPDDLLNKYIPNGGRVIACADECRLKQVPRAHYRRIQIPELPGIWKVDERVDGGTFHLDGH